MDLYNKFQQSCILNTAVNSIQLYFENKKFIFPPDWRNDKALWEKKGTFVTLTKSKSLRGCIGSILPMKTLLEDVSDNSILAAFQDPRFEPLNLEEMSELKIEISVLTTPQKIDLKSPHELLTFVRPLVDGIIIQSGYKKATFLPQVWEELKDPRDFFKHLCLKASLPSNFYITNFDDLTIYSYQVEIINDGKSL